MFHWLILVPYYFLAALATLPLLMVISRVLRLKVAINTLVGGAIVLSLASIIIPLACDWVDLVAFTGRPLVVLVGLSFGFAALDVALAKVLPLQFDDELREL